MSFSRSKLPRFSDSKDAIGASIKESTTSTNSKLNTKSNTDKVIPPKSLRNAKLPRPVRHRSLSRPSSPTATVAGTHRPCSVSGMKVAKVRTLNLEKVDNDTEIRSATVLPYTTHKNENSSIDEVKSLKSNHGIEDLHSSLSELKQNTSAIPLRVKSSQISNKDSVKEGVRTPREIKKFTSASHLSNLSNSTTPRKTNISKGSIKTARNSNLINQFEEKKKQLQALQDELVSKKGLVADSYNILVELKKRLEESDVTNIVLDELKTEVPQFSLEPCILESMTDTVNGIPLALGDICKNVMEKRVSLLNTFDRFSKGKLPHDELQKTLKSFKEDTGVLEKFVTDQFKEQQDRANGLIEKWVLLIKNAGDASHVVNQVEELKTKLKMQEQKVDAITKDLGRALKTNETYEKKNTTAQATIDDLGAKLKRLEQELAAEKHTNVSQKEKYSCYEHHKKTTKAQIQELERKCKEYETKQSEIQKNCKHAQEQLKIHEQRWNKEKEELISINKHDKQLVEKLTKEHSSFQSRVKTLEGNAAEANQIQKTNEDQFSKELEEARKVAAEEKVKRETLQQKYDHVQNKLIQMEMGNRDIVKTNDTLDHIDVDRIGAEREAELYTELLATRAALKAAEERLQCNDREKMRFISTIESLQADKYADRESISSLKNVQRLTELENLVAEKDDIIYRQQVEVTALAAEVEDLKLQVSIPQCGDGDLEESELKRMLYDGKTRLETLIQKSSEFEQKAISFQHELDKRTKQLYDMENLLKVRDGLIKLLKVKKDELVLENNSLNKYADNMRTLYIQTREEVKTKSNTLQDLVMNLTNNEHKNEIQEKKIKELERSLAITNEKRFKLQDAVGAMEKELQTTKAYTTQLSPKDDTWYDTNRRKLQKDHSSPYSHWVSPTLTPNSKTCDDPTNNYLESEVVRSWLSSYQNVEDIQKRLKFLKQAFASLSKKMIKQDVILKEASDSLGRLPCSKSAMGEPLPSPARGSQKRRCPYSKTRSRDNYSQSPLFPTSHGAKFNDHSNDKRRPSPDLYYNKFIKKNPERISPRLKSKNNITNQQPKINTFHNANAPSHPISNRPSSISIPKVRYSPLTLSSRPPVTSIRSVINPDDPCYTPLSKNASRNNTHKSYVSLFLNRGSVQLVEQVSHGVELAECDTNSELPFADINRYIDPQSNGEINMSNDSIQIRAQRNSRLDSSTDSTGSAISVTTVIERSEIVNKFPNDVFISKSKYVLKLYSENQKIIDESGDYTTIDGIQYSDTDTASFSDLSNMPVAMCSKQFQI